MFLNNLIAQGHHFAKTVISTDFTMPHPPVIYHIFMENDQFVYFNDFLLNMVIYVYFPLQTARVYKRVCQVVNHCSHCDRQILLIDPMVTHADYMCWSILYQGYPAAVTNPGSYALFFERAFNRMDDQRSVAGDGTSKWAGSIRVNKS